MKKIKTQQVLVHGRIHITFFQKNMLGTEYISDERLFDNLIVDVGKDSILKRLGGAGLTGFGEAGGIGTGDSTQAAAAGDTDLIASTNKLWKDIQSTGKVYVRPTLFISVEFGYTEANYTWNEIGLCDDQGTPDNDPADGSILWARQIDLTPLVKTNTKRAIVEWQLSL